MFQSKSAAEEVTIKSYKEGETVPKNTEHFEFTAYTIAGIVISAIKRNGLEATLQDLRNNCRVRPDSDEETYQDFLAVINRVSDQYETILNLKRKQNPE